MSQSVPLEWLNENEFRSYPLRLIPGKEVIIEGIGLVSFGVNSSGVYVINGLPGTDFLSQIAVGDKILTTFSLNSTDYVAEEVGVIGLEPTTIQIDTNLVADFSGQTDRRPFWIVKKNSSLDSENEKVNLSLDAIILDANLVYVQTPADISLVGQLQSVEISGPDLVVRVYGQPDFLITDYKNTVYPYYSRNPAGSLLVFGQAAKNVYRKITFANQFFESSVITLLDGAWHGVSSLAFNTLPALTGDIEFTEGYQLGLDVIQPSNTLKVSAGSQYGLPLGCARIYGPSIEDDCASIVSYISGASVRGNLADFSLTAGTHISIYPDKENHRIYVGLNFNASDVCQSLPAKPVTQI